MLVVTEQPELPEEQPKAELAPPAAPRVANAALRPRRSVRYVALVSSPRAMEVRLMANAASQKNEAKQKAKKPVLLSGSNPQVPLGYGDEPVQTYIKAVPGWKQEVCRRIDQIITDQVPRIKKAVKWNSPLYGIEEGHYFLSFHCFDRYVKVAFHKGALLDPPPPGNSKQAHVRYLDVHENDELGKQFASWVIQASKLPGEKM